MGKGNQNEPVVFLKKEFKFLFLFNEILNYVGKLKVPFFL